MSDPKGNECNIGDEENVDIFDPKYRFYERVRRLVGKGLTEDDAKEVVERVIRTKEQPPEYPELELRV